VADLIGIIESVYQSQLGYDEWLRGIAQEACALFDRGLGVAVATYDPDGEGAPQVTRVQLGGAMNWKWIGDFRERMGENTTGLPRPMVGWRSWLHIPCGTASQVQGLERLTDALSAYGGARDILSINGRDPQGSGVWLGVPLPRATRLPDEKVQLMSRVAAHLAAAYRLRRAQSRHDEAVLTPSGELLHAEGPARLKSARDELRRAVRRIDRARTSDGRKEAERATGGWRVLVDARWTVLDSFEQDGKRFVVATRNQLEAAPPPLLSDREQQVLAWAAMGHSNKEIAYELGLSASTVRVLIARAGRKLGVVGRAAVLARYRDKS
jgi:DNA-binding CsgD family transcriptional regulator